MPSSSSSWRRAGAPSANRSRAAGENQAAGLSSDLFDRRVVREELTEDTALADSPRYQLRVLATEVQDEYLLQLLARGS